MESMTTTGVRVDTFPGETKDALEERSALLNSPMGDYQGFSVFICPCAHFVN